MEKLDEKFEQLLVKAMDIFMRYGIKSVTMDDLARHLGVSKKTIYKYVKDKRDLILKGVAYHQKQEQCAIEECVHGGLNAIDELFEITKVILSQLRSIHPSVMYDLEKYYPEAREQFKEYKQTVVRNWVMDNFQRGINEGNYREDINIPILTNMYIARMDDIFNVDIYPENEFSFEEVYIELFRYHVRGISSNKGYEYLKEKMKELNKR